MKRLFNITTDDCDLARYRDGEDFRSMLEGFDGVELMYLGEDSRHIVPADRVIGMHLGSFPYWLDFWNGDWEACLREFGSMDVWKAYYGGTDREAILARFRRELDTARRYGAEYVVFHISDASIEEGFTQRFRHTDAEVIDGACALLNELFPPDTSGPALLMENLWQPGLRMTDPAMTERLLAGVQYRNKGIMLDTGHLLHTSLGLRTQREGLSYIHRMLDAHGSLCRCIRGVHLQQSLTGGYMRRKMKKPPALLPDYAARMGQMYMHAFRADRHQPFTCKGIGALIKRIAPEYLTLELISKTRAQHQRLLKRQVRALMR